MNDLPTAVVVAASLVAASTDLWRYRIYNLLTIPLLFSGLIYWLLLSGWWGMAASAMGAAVGFAALLGLYLSGGMGAGDVKLMAGLGAWLGMATISHVLLASCLATGLYALALLAWNRWIRAASPGERPTSGWHRPLGPLRSGEELARLAADPIKRRQLIPFGPLVLVGLLASLAYARGHL